jgi:hypothetical protein
MQQVSFKPGCTNYIQVKYVHPIIINCSVLKTMERLVDKRIRNGALTENPQQSHQNAYLTERSMEMVLRSCLHD